MTVYYSGAAVTGPYRFGSYHFDSTRVFTNKPPCGPKRGHGSVQPRFAFEVALDMAAEKLGLDPIEVRRKNFIGEDTQTINGQHITSNGFLQCLEAVEKASGWRERKGSSVRPRPGRCRLDVHLGHRVPHLPERAAAVGRAGEARPQRQGDHLLGRLGHRSGHQLAARVPHLRRDRLRPARLHRGGRRHRSLAGRPGAYSSRGTFMIGLACVEAGQRLWAQIAQAVAEHWRVGPASIEGRLGTIAGPSGQSMSFREAVQVTEARFGTLGATGSYRTQKLGADYRGGHHRRVARLTASPRTWSRCTSTPRPASGRSSASGPPTTAVAPSTHAGRGQIEGRYMGFAEVAMER
ncbi:MAG: molybdopterin-dependent oxidoreductase [Archangiaceae bacterium]|nr:molybdopterin-dependent oxidoreductase [Archangiaceae bacterium]